MTDGDAARYLLETHPKQEGWASSLLSAQHLPNDTRTFHVAVMILIDSLLLC